MWTGRMKRGRTGSRESERGWGECEVAERNENTSCIIMCMLHPPPTSPNYNSVSPTVPMEAGCSTPVMKGCQLQSSSLLLPRLISRMFVSLVEQLEQINPTISADRNANAHFRSFFNNKLIFDIMIISPDVVHKLRFSTWMLYICCKSLTCSRSYMHLPPTRDA